MHTVVPLTVADAYEALTPAQRQSCVAEALVRITRARNHHQRQMDFVLECPKEYLSQAWKRLVEKSKKFELSTPANIAAIIATTGTHLILEHKRAIFNQLKMEEEFQDRPTDALIFGIEEGDPAATNIQALTKLKQNAEEDRTALAQLALAVIDLVVASFNDDGESPYVRRVLFEGKRKLRLPRLDLDRREIALALGIDPNRISKVKTFIRLQAEGLSYWQLLRQSDDDEPHESNLTKSSGPSGDQPSTPFALGSVRND